MVRAANGHFYFLDAPGTLLRFTPGTGTLTAGGAIPTYNATQSGWTPLVAASDGQI